MSRKVNKKPCLKCNGLYHPGILWRHEKYCTGKKITKTEITRNKIKEEWKQKNGKYKCPYCDKEYSKMGIMTHINYHKNPLSFQGKNNGMYGKVGKNQYIKAKENNEVFIPSYKELKGRTKTAIARNKIRWSMPNAREIFSQKIREAIKRNPDAYSANNVCGRTKLYDKLDSLGNKTKLNGKWELSVAEYLNKNKIRWINKIKPFNYIWENRSHLYFPDFYLIDLNIYIEVKGYERARDHAKWKSVKNLIILRKKEIKLIRDNKYHPGRLR